MCAFSIMAFAQLPNGSYAPNFTGYEIDKTNGNILSTPITLYDMTDAGYPVFVDVFATWCGPCWNFHSAGYFEGLYNQYGPNGTNEVRVLGIEGSNGNYASLSGTGADAGGYSSQGNWLAGVEYPVIPLKMSPNTTAFNSAYAIAYFPTIYMICKNRLVYEVGQQSTANLYAAVTNTCPQYDASLEKNAMILEINGINPGYFCNASFTPTVKLQNVGSATLTAATFNIELDGQTTTYDWTGSLATYETATVTLPEVNITNSGIHPYTISIATVNGAADADPVMNTLTKNVSVAINASSTTIDEDFSNGIQSPWFTENDILFAYNITSGTHGGAVVFNAYSLDEGTIDELYMPYENLSGFSNPVLKFDLAYRQYSTNYSERLRVLYSTNCGSNWTPLYNKSGQALATVTSTTTSNFIPTETQWSTERIDLSSIANKENVILKFEFRSGYGNNVWIDNVMVGEGTGVEEHEANLNIYPNPVHSTLNIATDEMIERVEIYNMQGQLLIVEKSNTNSINVGSLAAGNYFARITTANGTSSQRFTKE